MLPLVILLGLISGVYGAISSLFHTPIHVPTAEAALLPVAILLGLVGGAWLVSWINLKGLSHTPLSINDPGSLAQYGRKFLSLRQLLSLALTILWWSLFIHVFDELKALIPVIQPFRWDELWMELDYYLHGGHHPWRLLHQWTGAEFTKFMDWVYVSWYPVSIAILTLQFWNPRRRERLQFLIAVGLLWFLGGNVMATLMSSAGPIYYAEVVGTAGPFEGLIEYLRDLHQTHHLFVWELQETLWSNYISGTGKNIGAISAMPSMHVALAALFVPMAHRVHRHIGRLAAIYCLLILVGSVHLGWHYALDGYVGILLAAGLWKTSGPLTRWYYKVSGLSIPAGSSQRTG